MNKTIWFSMDCNDSDILYVVYRTQVKWICNFEWRLKNEAKGAIAFVLILLFQFPSFYSLAFLAMVASLLLFRCYFVYNNQQDKKPLPLS